MPEKLPQDAGATLGPEWLTKQQMAAALAVTVTHLDRSYRPLAPQADRLVGKTLYIHSRTLLDAWVKQQATQEIEKAVGDPMLLGDGGDSPALEEIRRAEARIRRVKADEIEGKSVPLDELRPLVVQLHAPLRRAAEVLQSRFGQDAADVMQAAVTEWAANCERALQVNADSLANTEPGPGDRGDDHDPTAPGHPGIC